MIKGTLEITTAIPCKLMCVYCPQALLMKKYKEKNDYMTLETFKQCLDKVPKDISITFSGYAECFLNPETPNMMRHACNEGYELHLYTTLEGFKKEYIPEIKDIPFKTKHLHLPDMEKQMRGANVNEEYIENAIAFKEKIGYTGAICYGTLHPKLWNIFPDTQQHPNRGLHSRAENISKEKMEDIQHHEYVGGKIACGVMVRHGMDKIRIGVLLPNGNVQVCCLPEGSDILIGDFTFEQIQKLNKNDYIISHRGKKQRITKLLNRNINEEIIEFKTSNYFEPIQLTKNHPVLSLDRKTKTLKWRYPEEIKRLDYLCFPKIKSNPTNSINKDLMWLYGLYLAEGYTDKKIKTTTFCLNSSELKIKNRIKNIVKKFYPEAKINTYFYRKCNMDIKVFCPRLSIFLKENLGKYCDKKYISKLLMSCSKDELWSLVEGHFDGDGCLQKNRRRTITTSKQLAKQIYLIHLLNNKVPSFSSSKQNNKKRYYEITLSLKNNKMVIEDNKYFYFPIRKINYKWYTGKVYNFEVENDESYITNHVAVHNCMDYGLKHTLGNLITQSYEELFESKEYKRLQQGLDGDESIDILCRTCKEVINV